MYSILVLGLVPGTNIQISFWTWLILMLSLPFLAPRLKVWLREPVRQVVELGKAPTPHVPQDASQLHSRLQRSAR